MMFFSSLFVCPFVCRKNGSGSRTRKTALWWRRWSHYRDHRWEDAQLLAVRILQLGVGRKNFQNNKARIHLSGDHSLRNGLVSRVCSAAPDRIKRKFVTLERVKRDRKRTRIAKRARDKELLAKNKKSRSPTHQSKLGYRNKATAEQVDHVWGETVLAATSLSPKLITRCSERQSLRQKKQSGVRL